MKVLICGDRNWQDRELICTWLSKLDEWGYTTVIHGGARGADTIAGEEAKKIGLEVIEMPANWYKYGRAAGPIRNQEMLDLNPDLVIGFHSNIKESKGTAHCLSEARRREIETILVEGPTP